MFCPNCGHQNADNAAFAALLSVVAIFALIDLFDILPARFKTFKYSKYLGFDGIMTTILSIILNVLLTVSSAIGSWMTFASGMCMAQSIGKGISIAKNGAAMATASYVIVLLGDLIFSDLGDMDESFVAGYIISILLFILAMIGLEGNSLADNTSSVANLFKFLAFGCIAVQGVVHVSTANKMK